jgi:microcin C transport system substrate-binding protein
MKKAFYIFCIFSAVLLFGCGEKKKDEGQDGSSSTIPSEKIIVEEKGEYDPIANPKAIKGGTYTSWGSSFPKSLNVFLDYNSFSNEITGLMFESLVALHSTKNDPVGMLAESWEISNDKKTFTFHIHPDAKWSDGKPITAEDVQFYYDTIMDTKNMTSIFRVDLQRFERPKVVDEKTVEVTAKEAHWANFWVAAGMFAFPKHAWSGADFNKQNFEFPVVSGPYRLKEVQTNRYIIMERRADWWGSIKKYNQSKYNFDYIKYKFMADQNKVLEAFRKGDFDTYAVYTSSIWANQTQFEQVQKGWVVRQSIYNKEPKGFQGFALNLRRQIFQDVKVRKALCYLLNRELMNEKLMFNEYFLLNSYYPDLYANNINQDIELAKYDPEKARALLNEAGWHVGADGFLSKDGKTFEVSFLTSQVDLRHLNIYVEDLKKVGIKAKIEQVSQSTESKREDEHDFDMTWKNWGASRLRDPEASWDSSTADQLATNNSSGVKDPEIDSLIKEQKTEMSLDKRNYILKKIDRRLTEIIPYVLMWQADHTRLLYWNRFGTPQYVLDKFDREDSITTYWWLDQEKDKALKEAMKNNTSLPLGPEKVVYKEDSSQTAGIAGTK